MDFENNFDAPPRHNDDKVTQPDGLSLVSLHLGDVASLARPAMTASCDVLFHQREAIDKFGKTLGRDGNPGGELAGQQFANILNGGLGPMQMRVDRLNDFLKESGFRASYDAESGRVRLDNQRTGGSATYESEQNKTGETRVSPRPIAYRAGRR